MTEDAVGAEPSGPEDPIDPAVAAQQVLDLERSIYARPSERHDVARYLADGYWEVSEQGAKTDRETVLANLAASPLIVDDYPVDDLQVQVFGEVAIATGRSVLEARHPEPGGTSRRIVRATRFVHVWVVEGGEWRAVYAHNSNAPEP